ncbi:MAG: putative porin [Bacteroidota bacterium]
MVHRIYTLSFIFLLGITALQAQFPQSGGTNPLGNFGGLNSGGGGGNSAQLPSIDGTDSAKGPQIKPDIKFIDRNKLFLHLPYDRERPGFDIGSMKYFDEIEAADGFVQDLGLIGKPYKVWYHGFDERFRDLPFWTNPVMGRYNRYMLDPVHQVQYFDTKTPYSNINYAQGPTTIQNVKVTISQNITPLWNMAFFLNRRQAEGRYRTSVTDQYNMYLSSYYHSENNRYALFANAYFNDLANEINGGVPRSNNVLLPTADGLILDSVPFYNAGFFKADASPNLSEAQSKRISKGIYVDQYYHLLGYPGDTLDRAQRLTLRGTLLYQYYYNRYTDFSINTAGLQENLIPVYPTLVSDSSFLDESFHSQMFEGKAEASYTLAFGPAVRLNVNGGISYRRFVLQKDLEDLPWNITDQYVKGSLSLPGFVARANISQRVSDLFSGERKFGLEAALYPAEFLGFRQPAVSETDSTAVTVERSPEDDEEKIDELARWEQFSPVKLYAAYDFQDRNPTLFQAYYPSRAQNNYTANPDLVNQQLSHLEIGARYQPNAKIVEKDTLLPMYGEASAFFHTANRFIYYNPKLQPQQASPDEDIRWVGLDARFRLRFLKHFFLESSVTLQQSFTPAEQGSALSLYANAAPNIYGKASLYWDVRWKPWANVMRIGVDFYSNSPYAGQTVDPLSQEFFPTNYLVPFYPRIDVFASANLRGVGIFARYIHVNEGLYRAGYFTTPFYPALERSITFGVNWTFFN